MAKDPVGLRHRGQGDPRPGRLRAGWRWRVTTPPPRPVRPPSSDREDVDVDGDPWRFDEPQEISRRQIGLTIVIIYGLLVLAALVSVALGLDAAVALFVIGPFGAVVTAVLHHYFWRGRP